jgi:type I restriction enzyme M protein
MLFLKRASDLFEQRQTEIRQQGAEEGARQADIDYSLEDPDQYSGQYFYVPPRARWNAPWTDPETGIHHPALKHTKENVGSMLNKALEALEDANFDALQDVLKGTINFKRKIGQTTLDDDTLVNFIQNFDKIPLKDEDFEFPDLLGAAYEYLLKDFADQAGKKAGEFYTPAEVVRVCVEICDPQEGMRIYPHLRLRRHADPGARLPARARPQRGQRVAVRAGEDGHHLVHLQDEHAAARHPRRRRAE